MIFILNNIACDSIKTAYSIMEFISFLGICTSILSILIY